MLILLVSLAGLAFPIAERVRLGKAMRQANRSARGIFEFLERRPELHQNVGAHFLNALKEQITFDNVELESRSGRRLLESVSVEIPAGSRTAVMGQDEDARLALVCLIPRLLDPRSGRVLIDGHDLREVYSSDRYALPGRRNVAGRPDLHGYCTREYRSGRLDEHPAADHRSSQAGTCPPLHSGSASRLTRRSAPLATISKPDEQFRIALARAYLHDPSILIVEEPKSPIEDDTKHFIDDTLSRLSIGRTLVILPHRLSTFRSCDHVIVLQNGRVEESGSPDQLQTESKLLRHLLYTEFNELVGGEIEAGQMNHGEAVRKATS